MDAPICYDPKLFLGVKIPSSAMVDKPVQQQQLARFTLHQPGNRINELGHTKERDGHEDRGNVVQRMGTLDVLNRVAILGVINHAERVVREMRNPVIGA